MPRRRRDTRITQEIGVVGHAVDHVVIHVELLPAGVVRIPRQGRADVRAGDVHVRMTSPAGVTSYSSGYTAGVWSLDGAAALPALITGHGDVRNRAVAWMVWSAVLRR